MTTAPLIVGVDFDGTVVEHQYPAIGKAVPGAIECLRFLAERGAKLILWTVRDGAELAAAVEYLKANGIELFGVNENPDGTSSSPKVYCHAYVDDCAIGCPLVPATTTREPMADWSVIGPALTSLLARRLPAPRLVGLPKPSRCARTPRLTT